MQLQTLNSVVTYTQSHSKCLTTPGLGVCAVMMTQRLFGGWLSALLPREVAGNNLETMNHWIRTLTDRMVSMIWPNWHFTKLATGSGLKSSAQVQRLSFKMGSSIAFSSIHTNSVAFQRNKCLPTGDYLKIITSYQMSSCQSNIHLGDNEWPIFRESGGFRTDGSSKFSTLSFILKAKININRKHGYLCIRYMQ